MVLFCHKELSNIVFSNAIHMKRLFRTLLSCLVILSLFTRCNTQKRVEPVRSYNSIASFSLLNIPKEFLPQPGKCKVWFPEFTYEKQPASNSCKISFIDIQKDQILITNEGSSELPVYEVLQIIVISKGKYNMKKMYFSDQ